VRNDGLSEDGNYKESEWTRDGNGGWKERSGRVEKNDRGSGGEAVKGIERKWSRATIIKKKDALVAGGNENGIR